MDRLVWLACFFGALYAAGTTPDTVSTPASTIASENTQLPEVTSTSAVRTDEKNIVTTTDVLLANEIVEERATVQAIRSTESSLPGRKGQSTAKDGLTATDLKSEEEVTSKASAQVLTERSPSTTEAAHSTQTTQRPHNSDRPTSSPLPTTVGQTEQTGKRKSDRVEASSRPLPPLPIKDPNRKATVAYPGKTMYFVEPYTL